MRFVHDDEVQVQPRSATGLEVIAAGLPRCYTSSLQIAFEEHLGLRPSMHGAYIMPHNDRLKVCVRAAGERDRRKRQKLLHTIFEGYAASSDFPGSCFLDDLLEMYPGARIILNKRSSTQAWVRSSSASLQFYSTYTYFFITYLVPQSYWHFHFWRAMIERMQARHGLFSFFSDQMYERHNQWVRDLAKARGVEMLEWDAADGWDPLCKFLNRPRPGVDFPRSNEAASLRELRTYLIRRALRRWALVSVVLTTTLSILFWTIEARWYDAIARQAFSWLPAGLLT